MEVEGTVSEVLPNALYRVMLADGTSVLAHLSGQGRMQLVRLLPGDRVRVELSPFDPGRGRIRERI